MTQKELIACAALLCAIAIFTVFAGGSQPRATGIGGYAQYLVPAMLTVYLLVLVANARTIIESLASFFLANRRTQGSGTRSLGVILGWAIAVILIAIFFRSAGVLNIISTVANAVAATTAALHLTQTQGITQSGSQTFNPFIIYYSLLIFGTVILVSFSLFFAGLHTAYNWAQEERSPSHPTTARLEAMKIVQNAARNLRLTGDYREVILNCYSQMCHILSDHGFKIGLQETASEFSNSLSQKLEVGNDAVKGLTFLFEEARYSDHEIDDTRRAKALNELESLERSLAGT